MIENVSREDFGCDSERSNLSEPIGVGGMVLNDLVDVVLGNCSHYFFLK
jgi:hypothetical protein